MKATIKEGAIRPGININHRRESHFYYQYSAIVIETGSALEEVVTLRLYGTNARIYACIWHKHGSGSGFAGGGGYHKASAAACSAIKSSGIELSEDIDGGGNRKIIEAVKAIAEALYPTAKNILILEAHA